MKSRGRIVLSVVRRWFMRSVLNKMEDVWSAQAEIEHTEGSFAMRTLEIDASRLKTELGDAHLSMRSLQAAGKLRMSRAGMMLAGTAWGAQRSVDMQRIMNRIH